MNLNIIFLLTALLFASCTPDKSKQKSISSVSEAIAEPVEEVETRTNFFIKDTKGNYYNMEDFIGKRVFINYWATWCKPCIAEMPDIENAAKILKTENFLFFLVSDQSMSKIKEFEDKFFFNLTFAKLNGSLERLNIRSLPTTLVYDTKGNNVKSFSGAIKWDHENMLNSLREIK